MYGAVRSTMKWYSVSSPIVFPSLSSTVNWMVCSPSFSAYSLAQECSYFQASSSPSFETTQLANEEPG